MPGQRLGSWWKIQVFIIFFPSQPLRNLCWPGFGASYMLDRNSIPGGLAAAQFQRWLSTSGSKTQPSDAVISHIYLPGAQAAGGSAIFDFCLDCVHFNSCVNKSLEKIERDGRDGGGKWQPSDVLSLVRMRDRYTGKEMIENLRQKSNFGQDIGVGIDGTGGIRWDADIEALHPVFIGLRAAGEEVLNNELMPDFLASCEFDAFLSKLSMMESMM